MRCTIRLKLDELDDSEGYVVGWLVHPGDHVTAGEPLLTIEVDKVQIEYPSPVTGFVVETLVEPDAAVESGARLAIIDPA